MKPFETYQYLPDTIMTDRDKLEVDSKFWNKGKWDNFILPFLPKDCRDFTFVDIGCNAGLFLHLAKKKGFGKVLGVDSNEEAVKRGWDWKKKNGENYTILLGDMGDDILDTLPISDYVVLANVHYYFTIDKWVSFLDKLQSKTRNCIIVTAEKRKGNRCWAQSDVGSVRNYFKRWEEMGFIDELPYDGDVHHRKLWGLHFKSNIIKRVPIAELDSGNHVQDKFYEEIDNGVNLADTRYYRILKKYRKKWSAERLDSWIIDKANMYLDIKENGLKYPILVNKEGLILDGNHRCQILKHLGEKTIFIREV